MQSIQRRNLRPANGLRANRVSLGQDKFLAVYARTAADDAAGTGRGDQVRRALELVGSPPCAAVYADPGTSGLDAARPGLRRLLADLRRGGLRRVVVRDVARLARSAGLLETILGELRAARVQLVIAGRTNSRA